MEALDFARCSALNNIPSKKLQYIIDGINNSNDPQAIKAIKITATLRYAESNIPLEYWNLRMEKDFVGDPRLKQRYDEYVLDFNKSYIDGKSICFIGSHGTGKTSVSTCILKKAAQKNYSCLYTTFSDIIAVLTQASNEDKFLARQELNKVDFLVIDEVDVRFVGNSDQAADLFARSLEGVFRTRSQNTLPTLMCSNSPNFLESFNGTLKASLSSLVRGKVETFVVLGEDHRQKEIK